MEQSQEYKKALEVYKRIEKDFPSSSEGRQIAKYIARVEMLVK